MILNFAAFASERGYDVAAYVWPAYQPEPRWAELGIFSAGKGEWQNVWEAKPKWKGHNQPLKPLWGYENEVALRRAKDWCDRNTADGMPRLITVNSWNEWTEGSYLEPDTHFKFGYLEAVKRVFMEGK